MAPNPQALLLTNIGQLLTLRSSTFKTTSRGTAIRSGCMLVGLSICMVALPASMEEKQLVFAPVHSVEVTVLASASTYRIGEVIPVTVQLTNVSDRALRIPSKLWSSCEPHLGFGVQLLSEDGKEPEQGLAEDCFASSSPQNAAEQLRTQSFLLVPGAFLGARTIIHTGTYRNVKPGPYKIVATYRSWRQSDFRDGDLDTLKGMKTPVLVGQLTKTVSICLKR